MIIIFNFKKVYRILLINSIVLTTNALHKSHAIIHLKIVRIRVIYKKDLLHALVQKFISLSQSRRDFFS